MSEEEDTPESVLNKHKHKKFVKTDEDCEGYNASNSDNNFEVRRKQGNKCPNLKNVDSSQQVAKKGASRLSNSFTEPQKYGKESLNETNQDKDLWENLERAINKDHETSSVEETMTVSQFLDNKEADIEKKQSSLFRKEITGTREERVKQVNDYSVFLRPQGKIVSMV